MNNNLTSLRRAFSILELVIAIAIIGLLITFVGGPAYRALFRAEKSKAETELNALGQAITQYKLDTGKYPNRLEDLKKRPADVKNWQGYLEEGEVEIDPWGNEYQYEPRPAGSKPPFRLYSFGKDGAEASEDSWVQYKQ